MRRSALAAGAAVLVNLCIGAGAWAQGGSPPSPVRVAPVEMEEIAERRMVTGQLRSLRMAEVASQEFGVVVEIVIEVGQRVERGELLARLDEERLVLERTRTTAERAAAESTIAEERAAVDRQVSEIESLQTAAQLGASNARERRDADMLLAQAQSRLEKARLDLEVYDARLALLDRRLKDMRILAPFAGVVTRKLTDLGEWIAEGDSVCEIVATDELEVVLNVPQGQMAALASGPLTGEGLVVKLDAAGRAVPVEQVRIVPQIDERSRTFQLVGHAQNEEGLLAAGQSVVGWVPTGERASHLVVPVDAVLRNEMGPFVYVARQLGEGPLQAMPATVSVRFEMPGRVVVEAGALREGDLVVVEGAERLYPTAPIAPTNGAPAGAPAAQGEGAPGAPEGEG